MPRDLGAFPPVVVQHLLRLPRDQIWMILETLQKLCNDPYLVALEEEDGQQFVVAAGHAVFVDVDDQHVTPLAIRRIAAN